MNGIELSALRLALSLGIPGVLLFLAFLFLRRLGALGARLSGGQLLAFAIVYLSGGIFLFALLGRTLVPTAVTSQSPLDATYSFPTAGTLTLTRFLRTFRGRVLLDQDLAAVMKPDDVMIRIEVLHEVPLKLVLERVLIPQLPIPATYIVQGNVIVIRRRGP